MPICEKCGRDVKSNAGMSMHVKHCGQEKAPRVPRAKKAQAEQLLVTPAAVAEPSATSAADRQQAVDAAIKAAAQESVKAEAPAKTVEPVTAAVKVEPAKVELPTVGLPTTFTPEIPVGTKLMLNSTVWCKPPAGAFGPAPAVNLPVVVTSRQSTEQGVWLFCQAEDSTVVWAVVEADVIRGVYQILELATPAVPPAMVVPAAESAEDRARREKELADFRAALANYVDARDKKLEAEKVYKKVDKSERPIIWTYAEKNGRESAEGKQDFVVEDSGYRVHLERTPGGFRTEYENEAIVDWLVKNNHQDCIKMVPNLDMWKGLKEAGKVPPQIIAAVETPVEYKDTFALKIRELKEVEPEFKK